ncbi:MAG: peptide chain release factor N(5)-glutamine methyltransferase [Micromonosporaceae bacterium]
MSNTANGGQPDGDFSVRKAIVAAVHLLGEAGIGSPRVDAELLAAHVLGCSRSGLLTAGAFDAGQNREFDSLVRRRAARVPLQHLIGRAGFHRLELAVGPGGFVPRPETELLVEWGLSVLAGRPLVVDLCAGTGAIALAVVAAYPDATVYAVERDPGALVWLHHNATLRTAAGDRPVTVVAGDAVAPAVLAGLDGTVDLVLANPPYVPEGSAVPPEVAGHDPYAAVYAGRDGLDVIRPLVARAAALLRPGGAVGIEHDDSHGEAVPALLAAAGFHHTTDHADLTGRPRFATARRPAAAPPPTAPLP